MPNCFLLMPVAKIGPEKVLLFVLIVERLEELLMVPVVVVDEPVGIDIMPDWYCPISPINTASAPISAASSLAASAIDCQPLLLDPSMNTCPTTLKGLSGGPGNNSTCSTGFAGNVM